jgi:transcriptional/translational regulatory protein YebC/TACO1
LVYVAGGSADPEKNSSLAAALRNAKSEGVPKANIENALKKVGSVVSGILLSPS